MLNQFIPRAGLEKSRLRLVNNPPATPDEKSGMKNKRLFISADDLDGNGKPINFTVWKKEPRAWKDTCSGIKPYWHWFGVKWEKDGEIGIINKELAILFFGKHLLKGCKKDYLYDTKFKKFIKAKHVPDKRIVTVSDMCGDM